MPDAARAPLYRLVFALAAAYNIVFGLWATLWPAHFFELFRLAPPRYPSLWACLGMVIGVYGLAYAYAAGRLDAARPFIALGLLGKLLGPLGWLAAVSRGELPARTFTLIVFNDVVWWLPFALFLLDHTRLGAALRRSAPYVCAASNFLAALAALLLLSPGLETEPDLARRAAYIASHPTAWRAGWAVWIVAALSLLAFYAWWAARLPRSRWGMVAVTVASVGLACDLTAESLFIGWLPDDLERLAPVGTMLTGAAANGLYTVAGVILTVATPGLSSWLRAPTWSVWIAGFALTGATLAGSPSAMAGALAILMALFCPWVVLLGRRLA